jgi:uncharacterized iron-regulated protein
MVRQFVVSDIDEDYKLTQGLNWQKTMETEYRNKPVIMANRIFPVVD